jgi:hypothetical protein
MGVLGQTSKNSHQNSVKPELQKFSSSKNSKILMSKSSHQNSVGTESKFSS